MRAARPVSVPELLQIFDEQTRPSPKEMRAVLIRDPNKLVSVSVLSSPKLTESEVENFSKLANVSEEVLRIIGSNRGWTKNYGVIAALTRNPKTPLGISMKFVQRLTERVGKQERALRAAD